MWNIFQFRISNGFITGGWLTDMLDKCIGCFLMEKVSNLLDAILSSANYSDLQDYLSDMFFALMV